jgi:diaminohydroxyphosphoribosylaminopyrimidine deaminase/5-amino-6-(5-phosphoribosylamino)uracil reductase
MNDRDYTELALQLAKQGSGYVSPDPLVGAVVVNNGEIVGRGHYEKYGEPHAEAMAILDAGDRCKGATIYTNLEPCCHLGKNPPCTDAIISSGIKRVVSSLRDPNPKVNGGGFEKLKAAGIEVEAGVMEDEATELNEVFLKYIPTHMPFVVAVLAQTVDSKIAQPDGLSQWITCAESRKEVHRMRSECDAVLVGANTVRIDNPQLTVRDVEGRNPKRIIVAGSSPLPADSTVFTDDVRQSTIIACAPEYSENYSGFDGVTVWEIERSQGGRVNMMNLLIKAGKEQVASILVEGGSAITTAFFARKLVDRIHVFTAPMILGSGLPAVDNIGIDRLDRAVGIRDRRYKQVGTDMWLSGYPEWR